jgi:monomeric sarcosine oxidase
VRREFDQIVLGLGGLGSAAAYWLARRAGSSVLGLEQFELGHVRGESQDHSRIVRLSYHTPAYVEFAKRAYATWADVELDAGESLVLKTGGLDFAPRVSAIPLETYTASMESAGVAFERLDAVEIMRRWPPFRLNDDIHGVYQAESGIVMAARCNAAHVRLARECGATLKENAPVERISAANGEIDLTAGDVTYRAGTLIIAAGPWSNQVLASFGCMLPLTVTQEQVTYFASPNRDEFSPARFPIWIWMDDPSFYGCPVFGEPGPKVGQDVGGREVTADSRTFEVDHAAFERVAHFLRQYIPSMSGPPILIKSCLYTLTPDRDFVIDALPGYPNVLVAIGAGHAFKFASVIGRVLSELACDGRTASDVAPFALNRPILKLANPPKTYLV